MSIMETMLGNMRELGFMDFLFPWILFLAIIFAVLKKTQILGDEVSLNAVVAAVISFFIINYTVLGLALGEFFTHIFALTSIIVVGLIAGALILGIAGLKLDNILGESKTALAFILGFIALIVFISAGGLTFFNIGSEVMMTMLMILIMVGALMFIAK